MSVCLVEDCILGHALAGEEGAILMTAYVTLVGIAYVGTLLGTLVLLNKWR